MNRRTARVILTASVLLLGATAGSTADNEYSQDKAATTLAATIPLVAHWTFDEPDSTPKVYEAAGRLPEIEARRSLPRTRGVHGNALQLSGENRLAVPMESLTRSLAEVTLSAWTRPTELSGYREIFRQECPNRILFSYQNNGTILSLGLNVEGYVECDAQIRPQQVMDGQWHHCAASFDGRSLRVYLDGEEIGRLERGGRLATQGDIPAFIGSSGGRGEFFQGGLDDLQIFPRALTSAQIAGLYHRGWQSLAKLSEELQKELDRFHVAGDSFNETLARSRRKYLQSGQHLAHDFAAPFLARLKVSFAEDCQRFVSWTNATPFDYLVATGNEFHVQQIGHVVRLMLEYKPLTARQLASLTPGEAARWEEAEEIGRRYEALLAQGAAAEDSPEWLEILFQAGPRVVFRPTVAEAVAPYVPPSTPVTRTLCPQEAKETLERDWLHQANGNPTPSRIREEILWTRQLAQRIQASGRGQIDLSPELTRLDQLNERARQLSAVDREFYFQVRELKRRVAFKNPVLDFDQVLFVDMPFPQGREWQHETRHRLGYMAVPGARLLVLKGLGPAGELVQLMPQAPLHGSFWRPDLSYDAQKVLFCFKPHNEKSFHLYEIRVDGTGLVQLTDGCFDDLDPIYLPDGQHILFSTTRGHIYVRCMPPTNAYVLARCGSDGKDIYLISHSNEPDYLPSVMADGRILYTRWEYTDKPLWRAQGLWTVNPDGTLVNTLWGNQSVWPDLLKDGRSIPGSQRVMFTGSAHHNWFSGSVGIIDPTRGYDFPHGLSKITADVEWPESGNGPVDPVESPSYHVSGTYAAYYSPYPLSEQDFLVSASRNGQFVLYLMDVEGNRELIYEGVHNILHALPLKPRELPPLIPDRVVWPQRPDRLTPKPGILFSNNVYEGAPRELLGKAKYLRVLSIDPKTYTYWHKRPYISTGPVISMVQSDGVKRVLGTVPIEADGSVAFHAPAGTAMHFQLLDENQLALHTMRSFAGVMPGESRGCLGCHESHSRAPQLSDRKPLALMRDPQPITPPPWSDDTVSFARYVQPVLDQYCGKCHQGNGEARPTLDLTRRPGFLLFDEPYVTLTGRPSWGEPYVMPDKPPPGWGIADTLMVEAYNKKDPAGYRTSPPMTALSYKSRLIEKAASGKHHDVRVDAIQLQRLTLWVDTMCPFLGEDEVRQIPDPEFQGVDWLAIRPRIQTAPKIVRPGPVD